MIESGTIAAKMSGPSDESGPSTRTREGPKQRVADETGHGRVEAVHGRQAGKLGVGHALGHEDRGQDDARDEVGAQPAALVLRQQRDPRHPATGASRRHPHDASYPLEDDWSDAQMLTYHRCR